jgi:CRISPR-associated protein Cmr4
MTCTVRTYLAQTLDPIHVGTGEFRLGRVDNTIVREPGTGLPKIPGSSLAGVARAYTAIQNSTASARRYPKCAGKGGEKGESHCGKADCPVCTAYGFAKPEASFQGLAQFSDARILFFPVSSAIGPLWVTSPSAVLDAGTPALKDGHWLDYNETIGEGALGLGMALPDTRINLGWLYLPVIARAEETAAPGDWTVRDDRGGCKLSEIRCLKPVCERLVMVSDARFPVIVEDQLEVRTSVSISPETGAAAPGALFTAEAIPRATVLFFQVVYLEPTLFMVPGQDGGKAEGVKFTREQVAGHVETGLNMIEFAGIGGSNTRGMGRLRVLPLEAR